MRTTEWRKVPLTLADLCIDTTLRCGQSFRWRKIEDEWLVVSLEPPEGGWLTAGRHCSLHGRIISLKQDAHHLHYRAAWPRAGAGVAEDNPAPKSDDTEDVVKSYFNLQLDLASLYEQWSRDDANFRKKAPRFSGIRILNQDAWEALIAFICSSNNNISRITQMVQKLCVFYGPRLGKVGDELFHDFPPPEALAGDAVEAHLRQLGFGYRARYIAETARLVTEERPPGWLATLRSPESPSWGNNTSKNAASSYKAAHESLLLLSGVGPKVADCVCLMGLGWGEAVPVDTHVWQIAVRDYNFGKWKAKAMSRAMYDDVGDHFRQLWGKHAGWAQSVLFTANLRSFSERARPEPSSVLGPEKAPTKEEPSPAEEAALETRTKRERSVAVRAVDIDAGSAVAEGARRSKRRRTRS